MVSNTSVLEITPNGIVAPKIKTNEVEFTPFRLYVETDRSLTLDMIGDNIDWGTKWMKYGKI